LKPRTLLALFYIGPLILWMAFIFVMSTDLGNVKHSQGLLIRVLQSIAPSFLETLSNYQLHRLDYVIRKLGHFSEYMVLTMLAVRAIQFGRPALKVSSLIGALALSVGFALSDELHQRFVLSRSPSMRDVMIDSFGSAVCMLCILAWFSVKGIERRLHNQSATESEESALTSDGRPPNPSAIISR
jgi:VanZ family protein